MGFLRGHRVAGIGIALLAIVAVGLLAASVLAGRGSAWERGLRQASALTSPMAHSPASVAAGRAVFQLRCQACHGDRGRGDGPLAVALEPKPADLLLHAPQHTPGELFYFISEGVPGSAMPAWKGALSETERWQLVHYLMTLAAPAP